jgi:hypothetical protein
VRAILPENLAFGKEFCYFFKKRSLEMRNEAWLYIGRVQFVSLKPESEAFLIDNEIVFKGIGSHNSLNSSAWQRPFEATFRLIAELKDQSICRRVYRLVFPTNQLAINALIIHLEFNGWRRI